MQLLDNRYRDYVGFPPLLRSGENDGKIFSDFYRASQIELLSALDNALSQKAEETLTEFSAVKKADIQLQTQLGNRQGQIAANVIGAFAESQSTAFGWQVRVYGAENDTKGANVGVFFRRLDGESLYGINTFADYENGNYGEFLRYGIGGELQNRYASFAMNYYLPITDDKHTGSTVAFSQKGYDANLRINIPQLDFLKVRADYYHYDGDYGVKEDNGFRYGLELQPINDLRIGVFYDDGGEKFGGDIVYVYNIAAPAKRESKDAFSPDLFAPVLREYSQRIITATTGPRIEVLRTPVLTTFITTTIPAITTRTTTEMLTTSASRLASVHFTTRIDRPSNLNGFIIVTTRVKFLITLPPAGQITRPQVLTVSQNWNSRSSPFVVMVNGGSPFDAGAEASFLGVDRGLEALVITITEGSEEYLSSGGGLITSTLTTRTTATMQAITTTMASITYMTITLGITTNAATDYDNFIPPGFISPSMPQLPKMTFADSVIPAPAPQRRKSNIPTPPLARARMTSKSSAV